MITGLINEYSDTKESETVRHEIEARVLVVCNDFTDPLSKVRDTGVGNWTVSAAGFVAPGNDAHLVPYT